MADPLVTDACGSKVFDLRLLPAAKALTLPHLIVRLSLWILVLSLLTLAFRYDVRLMQWRYRVLPEGPEGMFKQIMMGFRDFGQALPIFVAMLIISRVDHRRWTIIICILMAQALASVGYNSGKLLIGRYRPYCAIQQVAPLEQMTTCDMWIGWSPHNLDDRLQSFPSGHSASAFAFAGVLAWFYPRLRVIFWPLAAGCALSRYFDAVHWMGDCISGACIGYAAAWLALRPKTWAVPVRLCRARRHEPLPRL